MSLVSVIVMWLRRYSLVCRYVIAGLSGVVANLLIFAVVVERFGGWHVTGAVAGFVAAYGVTFTLHKYWTFKESSPDRFATQSGLYLSSALIVLGLTVVTLDALVQLGVWPVVAQLLALGTSTIASFLFTSQVTFHADRGRLSLVLRRFRTLYLRRHLTWLMLLALVMTVVVVVRLQFFPITFSSDAVSYEATAQLLVGDSAGVFYGERFLKPLAPGVTAVLAVWSPLSLTEALLYQAYLGYIALGVAAYYFGWVLFTARPPAFVLATIVVTSYPIFRYGLDIYTETGVWALYFLALALVYRWIVVPRFITAVAAGVVLLAGLLWKEYVVLAGTAFFLAVLCHPRLTWAQKAYTTAQVTGVAIVPWLVWQGAVYAAWQYSYIDWLAIGSSTAAYESEYTVFAVGKSLFSLLFWWWCLVPVGVWYWRRLPADVRYFLWCLLVPSFGFFLWGYVSSRLFFSLVPFAVVLVVWGWWQLPTWRWRLVCVVVCLMAGAILTTLAFLPSVRSLLTLLTSS